MVQEFNGETYLSYSEAASELGVKPNTVSAMVSQGRLNGFELGYGREKFIKKSDIEDLKVLSQVQPKRAG